MRAVVGERAFRKFRDENLPTAGQQDADHASYEAHASFEKREGVLFTTTLSSGGKVEGPELTPQP